jgi:hypothetical protein
MSNRAKMIAIRQDEESLDDYCLEVVLQQALINTSVDTIEETNIDALVCVGKTDVPEAEAID